MTYYHRTWFACRFCKESADEGDLVKYGVRHYAHFKCYLDAGKRLDDLRPWQAKKFPFLLLKEYGLLSHARLNQSDDEARRSKIGAAS